MYLAITVLATITLYYELYVGGSVTTLYLVNLHMSFTFFSLTVAFGALIGAKTLVLESDCGHVSPGCEPDKTNPAVRNILDGNQI